MELPNPNCQCQWMGNLEKEIRSRKLKNLIIPGAHDSNTYSISKLKTLAPFARCQSKSLFDQLCLGVRFFDIRVGHFLSSETKKIVIQDISENDSVLKSNKSFNAPKKLDTNLRSTKQNTGISGRNHNQSDWSVLTKNSTNSKFLKSKNVFELEESEKRKIALRFKGSIFDQKIQPKSKINWGLDLKSVLGSYKSGLTDFIGKSNIFFLTFCLFRLENLFFFIYISYLKD